jgi:polyhydroxyalkanoate synthesis regulator phasin
LAEGILVAAAHAERLRRRRLQKGWLARVAPAAAGVSLVVAAIVRVFALPLVDFWIAFAALLVGVAISAWIKGRAPHVDDAAASALDADANLGGELRSAHWFASRDDGDDWSAFHLSQAEARLARVEWASVYPAPATARAWAGSVALVLMSIAVVSISAWPGRGRPGGPGSADAPGVMGAGQDIASAVPGDVQKQIDDLIKAIQSGSIALQEARTKLNDLRDQVANLDPKQQQAIADAMKGKQISDWNADDPDPALDELAKKVAKAANEGELPQDLKWSLQDLAAKLNQAARPEGGSPEQQAKGDSQQMSSDGKPPDGAQSAMQMTKSSGADAQSTQVLTTNAPMNGAKVDARGQQQADQKARTADAYGLSAMKKETIEANEDSQGENILSEMRRKSEQSRSKIGFSHVAPLATYDKSRAVAPPAPPDALLPLIRQYFIRR